MDILNVAVSSIDFLTLREKILLRKNIDTLQRIAIMSIEELSSIIGRVPRSEWNGRQCAAVAEKSFSIIQVFGIECSVYGDKNYPRLLKEIPDAPYMLFYRGDLSCVQGGNCVSVVGTRRICRECAESAGNFAKEAGSEGWTVVSGLANGIDSFAHKGALVSGGKTCAVLPCGIDTIVPAGNKRLAASILKSGGCILSEYAPGVPAEKWRFVQRNRIVAALCKGTVVVQAPPNSGALLTADFALDYNREVVFHKSCFCRQAEIISSSAEKALLKNNQTSAKAGRTCESYIRDGAELVQSFKEFVRLLGGETSGFSIKKEQLELF